MTLEVIEVNPRVGGIWHPKTNARHTMVIADGLSP
jgi:hypothetical protein